MLFWRRKRRRKSPIRKQTQRLNATQVEWAKTRNFLYYDGSAMPPIYTYKEEQDENTAN